MIARRGVQPRRVIHRRTPDPSGTTYEMLINFEMSGGYGGLRFKQKRGEFPLNTDDLPADQAAKLLDLIEKSGVMNWDPKTAAKPSSKFRDAFAYKLSLQDENGSVSLELEDSSMPVELRPLIHGLQRLQLGKTLE